MTWQLVILTTVIHGVLGLAIAAATTVHRDRMAKSSPIYAGEGVMLRQGATARYALPVFMLVMLPVLGVFLFVWHDWKGTADWMNVFLVITSGLVLLTLPTGCVMVWRYKVWAGPDGVLVDGVFRPRWFGYDQVDEIEETDTWFVIRLTGGRPVRVGKDLAGWAGVLSYIKMRVAEVRGDGEGAAAV